MDYTAVLCPPLPAPQLLYFYTFYLLSQIFFLSQQIHFIFYTNIRLRSRPLSPPNCPAIGLLLYKYVIFNTNVFVFFSTNICQFIYKCAFREERNIHSRPLSPLPAPHPGTGLQLEMVYHAKTSSGL